jgi:GH25 family lysozyme M1 (1,4-beta-N-acetylmuramidase)
MLKGIDVSYHQGKVDFKKVKQSGIDFVVLRSSYRKTADTKFFEYVKACREAGLKILGVYHFIYALSEDQALEEAKFCLAQIRKAGLSRDVMVFADFEYDSVAKAKKAGVVLRAEQCNKFTTIFCEYMKEKGYTAGIYANIDFYKNWYATNVIKRWPVWLADYSGGPDFDCIMQQFTSSGKVNGISGKVDMNYYYGRSPETVKETRSRQAVVDLITSWEGRNEADGSHKYIIDIYNSYTGKLPRGVKMQYDWAWCACSWSAIAIKLGYTDIMPIEISCNELIKAAKEMGCWVENDAYIANPGDAILYDWQDNGVGDNTGVPDHIGTIIEVYKDAGYYVVMEGNYKDSVKRRTISFNGKYIRGFITPKYTDDSIVQPQQTSGKDVNTIAREVISGKWGSGEKRKKALEAAGYDYSTVQKRVNQILNTPASTTKKEVTATCLAKWFNAEVAGTYTAKASSGLYCRNDAGTNKKALVLIPNGTKVQCYGYYSKFNGIRWLYVQFTLNGIKYTGFCSSTYLKK